MTLRTYGHVIAGGVPRPRPIDAEAEIRAARALSYPLSTLEDADTATGKVAAAANRP